jgi:hypothetical protein
MSLVKTEEKDGGGKVEEAKVWGWRLGRTGQVQISFWSVFKRRLVQETVPVYLMVISGQ